MYSTAIEIITPEIASEYLKMNTNNYRSFNSKRVKAYAIEMKNGNWKNNGQAIVFGTDGVLKDGQHRLKACVVANAPFETLVIRGCDEDLYDKGFSRTTRQTLAYENIKVNTGLIGAVRLLFRLVNNRDPVLSEITLTTYIKNNIDILNKVSDIVGGKGVGYKAACMLVVYCFLKTNEMPEEYMKQYFSVLNSGNSVGCEEPSPALVARRQIMSIESRNVVDQSTMCSIVIYSMRDFKAKKQRVANYRISNGISLMELVNKVKEIDGINV